MQSKTLQKYQVVLGSKSPRRQQFLKDLGLEFKTLSIDCEEVYDSSLKASQITEFLCQKKSKATILKDNELLITADTIVWCLDSALEKPKNKQEAVEMLQKISGHCHEVITSICLRTNEKQEVVTDKTKVYFNTLSLAEINHYIDQYQPYDKAGSYGIQEWIGMIAVSKIEGSYTNVVGLPTEKLYKTLKKF